MLNRSDCTLEAAVSIFAIHYIGCVDNEGCILGGRLKYDYRLSELSCQRWDPIQEKWLDGDCKVIKVLHFMFIIAVVNCG